MTTFVLIHGGWGGGFEWDEVRPHLESRGHDVVAIDRLTSVADNPAALGDLASDAALVRSVLDGIDGPVVLVGRSSGGVVVTEVADHPAIRHSIYVAAFWPPRGASLADLAGDGPLPPWTVVRDDGAAGLVDDAEFLHQTFGHDVDPQRYARYAEHFALQSMTFFVSPCSAPDRTHPTTYVVCTEDHCIPPQAQEAMAQQANHVERLASGHSPMWSMPEQVAAVLDAAAT